MKRIVSVFLLFTAFVFSTKQSTAGESCNVATLLTVRVDCNIAHNYSFSLNSGAGFPTCASQNNDDGWYRFIATTNYTTIRATSNKDIALALLSGPCGGQTQIACSNSGGSGVTEEVSASTNIGQQYYVWVDRTNGGGGTTSGAICVIGYNGPGDVISNLSIWLKGDILGAPVVSTWLDESGNGHRATQSTPSMQPSLVTDDLNFNNVASFDGGDAIGNTIGAATHTTYTVVEMPVVLDTLTTCSYIMGVDCSVCVTHGGGLFAGSCTVSFPDEVFFHGVGNSLNWRSAVTGSFSHPANVPILIAVRENAGATSSDIYFDGDLVGNATSGTYISTTNQGYNLGSAGPLSQSLGGAAPQFYTGKIAEVINYSGNTTNADHRKIESYLALKYGITLGSTSATYDYHASDATVIWTGDATYQNDVTGIGKDDKSALEQPKSKSENNGSMITIEATGALSDMDFMMWGNNALAANSAGVTDIDGSTIEARIARVWHVDVTNTPGTVNLTMDLTDVPGSITGSDLRLLVDADGTFSSGATLYTGTYSAPNVTFTNVTLNDESYFSLGSINAGQTPLPVQLLTFHARPNSNGEIVLNWSTASEVNNDHFVVQRSENGFDWEDIGKVQGAGNSQTMLHYERLDRFPFPGTSYYRLKQVDMDGKQDYSDIRVVERESVFPIRLYPNPANDILLINTGLRSQIIREVQFYNALGERIVKQVPGNNDSIIEIDLTEFSPGVYFVQLVGDEIHSEVQKLVVE